MGWATRMPESLVQFVGPGPMSTGCKPPKFINQYTPEAEKLVCLSETRMKLAWNKNKNSKKRPLADISKYPNLPFENTNDQPESQPDPSDKPNNNQNRTELNKEEHQGDETSDSSDSTKLFHSFQAEGTKLAEDGKYREALGKWEAALMLKPKNAVLHEQKAQVLLEIGDAWNAVKAATRAIELEPSWAEAWVTLGRAQLNFGEPDNAVESFDRALAIKPDSEEAREDRDTAMQLVKRRKQLHSSGMSPTRNRYAVGDKT